MKKGIHYDTYPPMMSDYDNCIENENYDNEIRWFCVPDEWAFEYIVQETDYNGFEDFEAEYICMDPLQDKLTKLKDYGNRIYAVRCVWYEQEIKERR